MSFEYLYILELIIFFTLTKCDLPSHCLVSDIEGKWVFYLDKSEFRPSLKDYRTSCGHGFPNKVSKEIGDQMITPFNQTVKLSFTLSGNYKVYKNNHQVGSWTPIYDQSFVIHYFDSIITASYKYYLSIDDNSKYVTNCGKTMLGWVIRDRNDLHNGWSCAYGIKTKSKAFLKKNSMIQTDSKVRRNASLLYQIKSDDLQTMIEEINEANLNWKARLHDHFKGLNMIELRNELGMNYGKSKLSLSKPKEKPSTIKNHKKAFSMIETTNVDYNSEDFVYTYEDFMKRMQDIHKDITIDELNQSAITSKTHDQQNKTLDGVPIDKLKEKEKDSQYVTNLNEVKKYLNASVDEIDENALPDNWDWRNVGGINYITPVESQGNCGSCYVFSTIHSLESRLRIQTDSQDKTRFSIQFPLSCNFYSEGCNGGYPYLVAKFLSEFELVPRECFSYSQSTNNCNNVCDYTKFPKRYTVDRYGYLGGFYGATNEIMMMKEIRARGPIPGNIKVPIAFNFYSSGIFSMKEVMKNSNGLSKTRMVDRNLSFETVEHSITLIGYGVENGVKYWIGKNTWGEYWGERGYFRMLRGENEQNIESMGDYFTIKVTDR